MDREAQLLEIIALQNELIQKMTRLNIVEPTPTTSKPQPLYAALSKKDEFSQQMLDEMFNEEGYEPSSPKPPRYIDKKMKELQDRLDYLSEKRWNSKPNFNHAHIDGNQVSDFCDEAVDDEYHGDKNSI